MYGYDGFPEYVSAAERRARTQEMLAELRKQGRKMSPVVIEGRKIATTFWGKAWCENLEACSDLANRLPRGRTYARNGSVLDVQIREGRVTALVSGSELYECTVTIAPLEKGRWKALIRECGGKIDSVVELLAGKLSSAVMQLLCRVDEGIFPASRQFELECSCPDGAWLCKHLAAVLYGVGARLDHEPELLFVLRGVDKLDLMGQALKQGGLSRKKKGKNNLADDNLADIFGIELVDAAPAKKRAPKAKARSGSSRRAATSSG